MSSSLARVPRLLKYLFRIARPTSSLSIWDVNFVVVNRCNQSCPMCNAGVLTQRQSRIMTFETYKRLAEKLSEHDVPYATFSGGEPTLVPDLPKILKAATEQFSEEVILISNFYTKGPLFEAAM